MASIGPSQRFRKTAATKASKANRRARISFDQDVGLDAEVGPIAEEIDKAVETKSEEPQLITAAFLRKGLRRKQGLTADLLKARLRERLAPSSDETRLSSPSSSSINYSKEYLEELRSQTPSRPPEPCLAQEPNDKTTTADVQVMADQQGIETKESMTEDIDIPDEAFITHIIEKRRQLAESYSERSNERKTDEFIPLEDEYGEGPIRMEGIEPAELREDDDDTETTRLQREDDIGENEYDMIAEGSDGRIPLSAKQQAEQHRDKQRLMQEALEEHEEEEEYTAHIVGISDDSDDDWEQAQIMKGAFGVKSASIESIKSKPTQSSKSAATLREIPDFETVLKRLKLTLEKLQRHRDDKIQSLRELTEEEHRVGERKKQLQLSLESQTLDNLQNTSTEGSD
ncbi:nineteen complex-related protein 2-domain-containing protein [Lipomyces oligophaga]|uniref:nineteen complex-related protein 2-domain-containing protein n=1 Tax=Lipomyces oligophaga TaxID=45792 RepID=UPI0034CF5674